MTTPIQKLSAATLPSAADFRTTYLSSRTAVLLGQHALELPVGHPIRVTLRNLLERWNGEGVDPFVRPEKVLTRDEAIALIRRDTSAGDFFTTVVDLLGITDADVSGDAEQLMAEAA